jgi:hypothetical protein
MDIFQNPNQRIDQAEKDEERKVDEMDRLERERQPVEEPEDEDLSREAQQPPTSGQDG